MESEDQTQISNLRQRINELGMQNSRIKIRCFDAEERASELESIIQNLMQTAKVNDLQALIVLLQDLSESDVRSDTSTVKSL